MTSTLPEAADEMVVVQRTTKTSSMVRRRRLATIIELINTDVGQTDSVYLLGECSYERAALPMGRPRYTEAGSLIFIGDRDGRHGVCDFGQRRIEGDLVPTEMIFVADATGLHGGKMTGSKQRRSMVLVIVQNLEVHGSSDN